MMFFRTRTFGVCQSGRGASGGRRARRGLCGQCEKVWRYRGCPKLVVFYADRYTVLEELAMAAPISLAGLSEQLRLELLFIAQQFSLQKRKSSREAWRGLVRDARAAGVGALLQLERKPASARTTAYDELSRGEAGLAGAATARAEAHTVRVALLYALLDCSEAIRVEHLEAALAFWAYSAASARWVFGDSIGDPTADEIWAMARERHDGITRTEVSNLFSRNKKAREIDLRPTSR